MHSDMETQLRAATKAYFDAFCATTNSITMLEFFSTGYPPIIQHASTSCAHPQMNRLQGTNAVRSYFDLLSTYWKRSNPRILAPLQVDVNRRHVVLTAAITWTWQSGKTFTEEFTWNLDFDDDAKIISFVVWTTSPQYTCVMLATDRDPKPRQKPLAITQGGSGSAIN